MQLVTPRKYTIYQFCAKGCRDSSGLSIVTRRKGRRTVSIEARVVHKKLLK